MRCHQSEKLSKPRTKATVFSTCRFTFAAINAEVLPLGLHAGDTDAAGLSAAEAHPLSKSEHLAATWVYREGLLFIAQLWAAKADVYASS